MSERESIECIHVTKCSCVSVSYVFSIYYLDMDMYVHVCKVLKYQPVEESFEQADITY